MRLLRCCWLDTVNCLPLARWIAWPDVFAPSSMEGSINAFLQDEQQALSGLLRTEEASPFTPFNQIKEAPKSATLTHLDEWLSRLLWLQSQGNTGRLVEGIRQAKISYLAEEARVLHASDFSDFLPPKRFALLVCPLHQATIATRDEIVQMFIKRMSKLTTKAKEELERLRKEDRTTTERLIDVFTEVLQTNRECSQ